MKLSKIIFLLVFTFIGSTFFHTLLAQQNSTQFSIFSLSPLPNAIGISPQTDITVVFDSPMAATTLNDNTFLAFGNQSGFHNGVISYDPSTQTATFNPTRDFFVGEVVTVVLTAEIQTAAATGLASGYSWFFTIGVSGGSGSFQLDEDYGTEGGVESIYGGDLDNDGDIDLAGAIVANSKNLIILLNDGAGVFKKGQMLSVGRTPRSICGADFDRDGDIDLVTANDASDNISILFNKGNGSFESSKTYKFNENPFCVVANDFDGDGYVDLATANRETNGLSILLNKGNGTFAVNDKYPVAASPRSLTSGDFNRDGSMDLAVAVLESNQITIYINKGDGTFELANTYHAGSAISNPHVISAAEINGDYNLDLIVTNRGVDSVLILQNRSDGSFFERSRYEVGDEPRSLYLGDLDYDIDLDMVTGNFGGYDIFVHLNDGNGDFFIDSTYVTGNSPSSVFGGDFDKDGDIDLAVANFYDKTISILKNENSTQTNYAPDKPLLLMPQHGAFLSESKPNLAWQVPADKNGDSLHFLLELNDDSTRIFDSSSDPLGFYPATPVRQGVGSMGYWFQQDLPDGRYEWRVAARDQNVLGEFSNEQVFTVDTTRPFIDSLVSSSPNFPPNWFSQNRASTIELRVYYDEIHASSAKLSTGMLQNLLVKNDIQGGFNQMVKFLVDLTSAKDGAYWLVSIVEDSASNSTRDSLWVQLDSTAPTSISAAAIADTSSSTSFVISWGNATDSGAGVSGYDVRVKIDNQKWQDWLSDTSVTAAVYSGENRHLYSFEARARDNLDNLEQFTGTAEAQVYVDTKKPDLTAPSAPLNLTAGGGNPSPWQKNQAFNINWINPPDPSGIRRSWYKLGSKPNSNADTTGSAMANPPFNLVATNEDGQELYLWLEDGRGNVDFRNHSHVTMRYDITTPLVDSLVALSPDLAPNLYNQDSTQVVKIRIYFHEAHLAGGTLATGGLGTLNVLNGNAAAGKQTMEFDINIANNADGNYQLQATLRDSAGNQGSSSPIIIKLDSTPPAIAHTPLTLVDGDQQLTIKAVFKDSSPILLAQLYYRKGGSHDYYLLPMAVLNDSTFSAIIPGQEVGSRGIDYFLSAGDGLNVSHSPAQNWDTSPISIQVRVIGDNDQGLVNDHPQPAGSEQNAFRMISVPLFLDNPKADAVLEDDLGAYDLKKWRFFHYNSDSGTYDEFPDTDEFSPGKAFWLIVKYANKAIDSGIGTSVPADKPFVIPLKQGWNDIANPFHFAVDWNNISVRSGKIQDIIGPYGYEDRWLIPSEIVKILPWKGYSVYTEANDLALIVPPIESSQGLNRSLCNIGSEAQWQLILEATCEGAQDVANIIGCSADASADWDNKDYLEPPHIGSYVSLLFPHDDWERYPGSYTTDFRPDFDKGETWDFQIKTNIENAEVKLRIVNAEALPSGFEALLLDVAGFQKINICDSSFYSFKSQQNVSVRSFKLVIGFPEFINEVEKEIPLAPDNFQLAQNYPNPFNLGTQIQFQVPQRCNVSLIVFNLLGQEIRTLVDEEREIGYYKVQWNGRDDNNRDVGTGIYIIRMKAGDFVQTRKMILTK